MSNTMVRRSRSEQKRGRIRSLTFWGLVVLMGGLTGLEGARGAVPQEVGVRSTLPGAPSSPVRTPPSRTPMAVPFGPGERAEYQVKLGAINAGNAVMEITGVEPLRGLPSYHVSWTVEGGVLFARVNDRYQSWMDVTNLASRRFLQNLHQVRYRSERHYEIIPEGKQWERIGTDERGTFTTDVPLDDIAFIYYVRTIPLVVGETYTLNRYFREDRNPVTLRVLRKETIEVPAGTFNTIVVQPIIKAGGLFGEGGNAEVHFTDDHRRILVRLTTKGVPLLGNLTFHLRSLREGTPLVR